MFAQVLLKWLNWLVLISQFNHATKRAEVWIPGRHLTLFLRKSKNGHTEWRISPPVIRKRHWI